jgi:DNA repair exonuclease SbcCD ATPase subunit
MYILLTVGTAAVTATCLLYVYREPIIDSIKTLLFGKDANVSVKQTELDTQITSLENTVKQLKEILANNTQQIKELETKYDTVSALSGRVNHVLSIQARNNTILYRFSKKTNVELSTLEYLRKTLRLKENESVVLFLYTHLHKTREFLNRHLHINIS